MTEADFGRFDLYAYWTSLSDKTGKPLKTDFDPIEVPQILRFLSMVLCADRLEDFTISVWGSELIELFREERTGKSLGELQLIENWEGTFAGYLTIRDTGLPNLLTGRTVSSERKHVEYERLSLPLWGPAPDTGELAVTHIISQFRKIST